MDELREQVNHLYDTTYSPQIRKIEGSDEWPISHLAAHLFLEKIPCATDRLPRGLFSPTQRQTQFFASNQTPHVEDF